MPDDYREFAPAHWPDVLVLVDEQWCAGELRAWIRDGDGWDGYVQYRTAPGQNYLARFPAERIREAMPPGNP